MDINNSTKPDQERNIHTCKYARSKCYRRTRMDVPRSCGVESKMQHAGNPRDVTTDPVRDDDDDDISLN